MQANEQPKIFITNNDIITLNLHTKYLKYIGATNVTPFDDLQNCLNSLSFNPDLIFLGQNIDLLDSFRLLKQIKGSNPKAHIVIISRQENIRVAIECISHGAFDYILKNGDEKAQFRNVIEKIISEKQRSQKEFHPMHKLLHSF